jgi:hypothetical protein
LGRKELGLGASRFLRASTMLRTKKRAARRPSPQAYAFGLGRVVWIEARLIFYLRRAIRSANKKRAARRPSAFGAGRKEMVLGASRFFARFNNAAHKKTSRAAA